MNRSFEIPVQEVDSGASGYMAKHMSSNTIPSFFPVNLPSHPYGRRQGGCRSSEGPIGSCQCWWTPDVDGLEIGPKGQAPVGVVPLVGELGGASDIISDEFDVANRADFHSSDVNGFPQG